MGATLRTYYIETYGCQMNEHDSEKIAALLEEMGMAPAENEEAADVIVINTCAIREKAEHKVYSALGKLKRLKTRNPGLVAVVAGCVAEQEKERLLKRVDHLDAVVGTHFIDALPAVVDRVRTTGTRAASTGFVDDVKSLRMPAPNRGSSPVCSYVTVMQGCSNFCSYCVVPFTRGPEQSRPSAEIVLEVESLIQRGVKEITLLGQNVNAYGKDRGDASFPKLLTALDLIEGLERIRFTTSHPKDFDEVTARAMAELPAVCPHIHLPLQSGSDRILEAMGRRYTRSDYMNKVRMLRERVPGVAITADMIVGFPGETEDDFLDTLFALEEIRYDQIFSFKYSSRPGTAAARLPNHLPEEVKAERLSRVHAVQEAITQAYHQAAVGSTEEVLIEGVKSPSGQPFGRTPTNKIVNLEADASVDVGETVLVTIVRGLRHSLLGSVTPPKAHGGELVG